MLQSYFLTPPIKDGKCDHYWGEKGEYIWNKQEKKKNMNNTNELKSCYVIVYKEDNSIEAVVESKSDFKKWLSDHNKRRKDDGEIKESSHEFDLVETKFFTK